MAKITLEKLTFELDKTDDIKNLQEEILSLFKDDTSDSTKKIKTDQKITTDDIFKKIRND